MKRFLLPAIVFALACALGLTGCGKNDSFSISITVPAGSTEAFVYSDEEICPKGDKITVSSGEGLDDTEVILKTVDETLETGYVATYLTPGMPVEFHAEKGEWLKIGVSLQNPTDEEVTVYVVVEGVEVRIE